MKSRVQALRHGGAQLYSGGYQLSPGVEYAQHGDFDDEALENDDAEALQDLPSDMFADVADAVAKSLHMDPSMVGEEDEAMTDADDPAVPPPPVRRVLMQMMMTFMIRPRVLLQSQLRQRCPHRRKQLMQARSRHWVISIALWSRGYRGESLAASPRGQKTRPLHDNPCLAQVTSMEGASLQRDNDLR